MIYENLIKIDQDVKNGVPCVRKTEIPVVDVIEKLEKGYTWKETMKRFSKLTETDIIACLAYEVEIFF
jgi:uncharacterized protein (DUF433 family)